MERTGLLTRILATVGTALVWFPMLAPILLSALFFVRVRILHFDYLIPLELFPSVLLGGGMLFWAALRARSRRRLIGGGLAAAAGLLVVGQALVVVTGLASGRTEPEGWLGVVVLAWVAGYCAAVAATGVGGVMLLRELFMHSHAAGSG